VERGLAHVEELARPGSSELGKPISKDSTFDAEQQGGRQMKKVEDTGRFFEILQLAKTCLTFLQPMQDLQRCSTLLNFLKLPSPKESLRKCKKVEETLRK
jgi:hypothetical protein